MPNAIFGPIERIIKATAYSVSGLGDVSRMQAPFRYECYIMIFVVPVAWSVGKNGAERSLLIGNWIFVIVVALINSAIETAIDRIAASAANFRGAPRI
jgi:diacylglycerol kinase (ATP)